MQNIYNVPEVNLDTLKVRLAKIARRCRRIKIAEPVLTVGQHTDVEYIQRDEIMGDQKRVRRVFSVTLDSPERPKIEGFEFAAVISPVTDEDGALIGNVLRMVPGFEGQLPERFRTATNHCDHCNTDRRRLETFVIASADGFKQVGRNCLANYLGLTNPHMLAELAQILIDAADLMGMSEDSDGFGGAHVAERVAVDDVLQVAASAIRNYGWLSNKSAREFEKTSTSSRVREWIFGSPKDRERFEHALTVTEADKQLASETEAWLETLIGTNPTNDYLYNLSLMAQATSVTAKNFGILVSAISAYSREKEREIRRNQRLTDDSKSEYVGTIGERATIQNVTVVYTTTFKNDYGVTHFYKMKDGNGNLLVYFSSKVMSDATGKDWAQGTVIPSLDARIKKQELREGIKQTVITRATLTARTLTKEDKRAIAKLKRILKTVEYSSETYLAHRAIDGIIESIKRGEA